MIIRRGYPFMKRITWFLFSFPLPFLVDLTALSSMPVRSTSGDRRRHIYGAPPFLLSLPLPPPSGDGGVLWASQSYLFFLAFFLPRCAFTWSGKAAARYSATRAVQARLHSSFFSLFPFFPLLVERSETHPNATCESVGFASLTHTCPSFLFSFPFFFLSFFLLRRHCGEQELGRSERICVVTTVFPPLFFFSFPLLCYSCQAEDDLSDRTEDILLFSFSSLLSPRNAEKIAEEER